jgi:hypothetical protein
LKILLQIVFVLIANFTFAQNIWEPVNFPDTLVPKALNAEKEGILFVATGADNEFFGLFRSYDDGNTWELLDVDTTSPYINIYSIRYSSEDVLFLGANGTIYRSFDNGDSFEEVFSGGGNISEISFSPSGDIFAIGWSDILRSSDNGNTWDIVYLCNGVQYFSDMDFGLNGEIYTVCVDFQYIGPGFYRSLDGGDTWENIGITDAWLYSIRVNNEGTIIVSGEIGNFTSNDSGESWTAVDFIPAQVMESDAFDNLIGGCSNWGSGCWFSDNWGETWVSLVDSVINPYVDRISVSPDNHVYILNDNSSSNDGKLFKSINPILGVNQPISSPDIQLYPNPAKSILSVVNKTSSRINQFVIYNQVGQKVLNGRLADDHIDVTKLTPGLFIVELELEKNYIRKKIVIE